MAGTALVLVAQSANDDYLLVHDSGRMEIRRREDLFWVAIDFDPIVGPEDDDIVIDEEIGIIKILVLAPDADKSPVRQTLLVCPIRSNVQIGPSSRLKGTLKKSRARYGP